MSLLGKYTIILLALIAVLAGLLIGIAELTITNKPIPTSVGLQLLLIFFCVNLLAGYMLTNSMKKRPQLIVRMVMGSTVLKLFAYLIALVVYLLLNRESAVFLTIAFFSYYLTFTVVEKVFLLKHLKSEKEEQQ